MEFNKFLDRFWDVFLLNVCCFHNLDNDFLEKYEYEIDWKSISLNRNLNWTQELLEKYESRFLWHELAWNPSISWTSPLIKKFKKRLDWYYLGRNINLPISKEFIDEHRKNILIIENNKFLTRELEKYYDKNLLPAIENSINIIEDIDIKNLENQISENIREFRYSQIYLYEKYILPNLKKEELKTIFESKFPYNQRYFKLKPIHDDVFGLTPEFKIEGDNPFDKHDDGRPLNKVGQTFTLIKGSLQEGKDRLYEIPREAGMTYYPVLIVSENVKTILEQFVSTIMKFHKAIIKHDKIKPNVEYYILEMETDSVFQLMDFDKTTFLYKYSNDWFGCLSAPQKVDKKITSYEEIAKSVSIENAKQLVIYPESYFLKKDYDVFTIKSDFIVNEFVKDKLEKELPDQIYFESAELLKIGMNQEDYDKKKGKNIEVKTNKVKVEVSPETTFFIEKMERLKNTSDLNSLKSAYNDNLSDFENSNGVIFSDNFRTLYLNGLDYEEYKLLKVADFYIEEQYQDRYPETYRAVVVAENGCGDSLGLILKKNSDYELDDVLVEFLHETGEIEIGSNISPTMYIGNGGGSGNSNTSAFKKLINKLKGK
jgi:hypothetical protein